MTEMQLMQIILVAMGAYAAIGLAVGTWFVLFRVPHVDAAAGGSSVAFRLLILPGAAALWPAVLRIARTGPRAAEDPACRRTAVHRRIHRRAWPLLLPATALLVILAARWRTSPAAVEPGVVPAAPPSGAVAP